MNARSMATRAMQRSAMAGRRLGVPGLSLTAFAVVWTALAIAPRYRVDWLLENVPTLVVVPAAILLHRRRPFSSRACVQAAAFGMLHAIGSHYTYSAVPVGDWIGQTFAFARNHYDRGVHFAFGALAVAPLRELTFGGGRRLAARRELVLTVALVGSISVAYEIVEWMVAAVVDPEAGTAFLGTQGDVWDAQKDMACAALGALTALPLELLGRRRTRPPIGDDHRPRASTSAASARSAGAISTA